jgi:hypothetical protein
MDVVPHPSAVVTRELYEQIGAYREDLGTAADQEFFLRASVVAEPAPIPGMLAAFELGGTSSREGLVVRELAWRRLRLASGTAFGGRSSVDVVVTGLLIGRQLVRWAGGRVRRRIAVPRRRTDHRDLPESSRKVTEAEDAALGRRRHLRRPTSPRV